MKKVMLGLGLTLMLLGGGWQGYHGFGLAPAYGQPPPPPSQYYCDPYYYQCYYSEPYADPLSQFLYYFVPQISGELQEREEWEHRRREFREFQERRGFEHREGERGGHFDRR